MGEIKLILCPIYQFVIKMIFILNNSDMSSREKAAVYRERMQLQQQKNDVHGLWCSDLYRLSIANKVYIVVVFLCSVDVNIFTYLYNDIHLYEILYNLSKCRVSSGP